MYFLTGRGGTRRISTTSTRASARAATSSLAVESLEREQVRYVVWMADGAYDPPDRGYFPILRDYVRRNYVQVDFVGPFRILERVRL